MGEGESQPGVALSEFRESPSISGRQVTAATAEKDLDNVGTFCLDADDIGFLWPIGADVILNCDQSNRSRPFGQFARQCLVGFRWTIVDNQNC
ncbi:hypothetical protein DDZ14_17325 [Maritimibacter sp. 55A14]|nr:hypothetical protein DDZ14_17325 [Maritimibacter sp. 55A14]